MENVRQKNKRYYLFAAITLGIMFLFPCLPNIGLVTDFGMQVLGILIGVLFGWIFVDFAWPSIFALIMLGSVSPNGFAGTFTYGFGNQSVVTCIIFFALAKMFEEMNVTNYIAGKMLSTKFIKGKPWLLVAVIFLIAYVLGMVADMAGYFLTWSIALAITDLSGYKRNHILIAFFISGIVLAATAGGFVLPFKVAPVIFLGFLNSATGLVVDSGKYIIFMLVITLSMLVLLLLFARYILKIDVSQLELKEETLKEYQIVASKEQKIGLLIMGFFFLIALIPSFLPDTISIIALLKNWGALGCAAFVIIIPAIWRNEEGKAKVPVAKMMSSIGWDVMWLLMTTMTLANLMNSPETGVMDTVSATFLPLLGEMNPSILILLATIVVTIVTQFMSNVIVGAIFMPFVIPLCIQLGGNPILCFMMMFCGCGLAYATPASSMTAALFYGHSDVSAKHAYGFGALYMIIGMIVVLGLGLPLGKMIF